MTPISKRMPGAVYAVRALAILAAVLWLLDCSLIQAQQWEYKYGSTNRLEDGKFRVIPVNGNCANVCFSTSTDGYIAVGTTSPQSSTDPMNSDVHIVRTDNNGARIWETTYDITGNNDWDEGWSIIELSDGSGFVVTGQVRYATTNTSDVFLMKVDCNGFVVWTNTYGGPFNDGGRDLIQTTTGNPGVGTNPGDLVVAGYSFGPGPVAGTMDGYLLRTTVNGALIWDQTYHFQPGPPPGQEEFFYSLTEARRVGGALTGDIIAAGYTMIAGAPATQDALVARVNGDNGAIAFAPQGAATYGIPTVPDDFSSVIELQNPAELGVGGQPNVVLLGIYGGNTIYAVKLNGGDVTIPPLVQQSIAGAAGEPLFGRTIREITFPTVGYMGTAFQWDLMVTGWIQYPTLQTDAILMSLNAGALVPPPGGLLFAYGGNGGDEQGWSVYPVDATAGRTYGFVVCGHTTQMWYFPPLPNAQQDMYLFKTDGFGRTGCERPLAVVNNPKTGKLNILLNRNPIGVSNAKITIQCWIQWELLICPRPAGVPCTRPDQDGPDEGSMLLNDLPSYSNPDLFQPHDLLNNPDQEPVEGDADLTPNGKIVQDASGLTSVYPNPVKVGDPIHITSPIKGDVSLSVTNTAGQSIMSQPKVAVDKDGSVIVKTNGWTAGAYLVTVRNGDAQSTIRVVVVE